MGLFFGRLFWGLLLVLGPVGLVAVGPLAVVLLAVHVALLLVLALAAVAVAFGQTRVAVISIAMLIVRSKLKKAMLKQSQYLGIAIGAYTKSGRTPSTEQS